MRYSYVCEAFASGFSAGVSTIINTSASNLNYDVRSTALRDVNPVGVGASPVAIRPDDTAVIGVTSNPH